MGLHFYTHTHTTCRQHSPTELLKIGMCVCMHEWMYICVCLFVDTILQFSPAWLGIYYVAQISLELLLQPSKCWNSRHVLPHPANPSVHTASLGIFPILNISKFPQMSQSTTERKWRRPERVVWHNIWDSVLPITLCGYLSLKWGYLSHKDTEKQKWNCGRKSLWKAHHTHMYWTPTMWFPVQKSHCLLRGWMVPESVFGSFLYAI